MGMRFAGLLSSAGNFSSSFFCSTAQFLLLRKVPELPPAETRREEPAQMCLLIYFN